MTSISDLPAVAFKAASAEAAMLELQMRLCAGTLSDTTNLPIDTNLGVLKDAILEHFKAEMTEEDKELLSRAHQLRNKLLHCEFSAARKRLNESNPRSRDGGITVLPIDEGMSFAQFMGNIQQINEGADVGQKAVADTKTKKLKDVFSWLLECFVAEEFQEAEAVFTRAVSLLERLMENRTT